MPIIEIPPNDSPLSQGDILRDISLYLTGEDWASEGGGADQLQDAVACLVISRPCVLVNKPQIVVAAIHRFLAQPLRTSKQPEQRNEREKDKEQEGSLFKDHCTWFDFLRDGVSMPDRFYLGRLPSLETQRHCANLDSLHTIKLPAVRRAAGLNFPAAG